MTNTITKILDAVGKSRLLSSVVLSDEALLVGLGFALFYELAHYLHEQALLHEETIDGSPDNRSNRRCKR